MKQSSRRLIALGISILVHVLLLALLYLLTLQSKERTRRHEEVVLLDLGNVAEAGGDEEPEGRLVEGEEASPKAEPEIPQTETKPKPQTQIKTAVKTPAPQTKAEPKPQAQALQTQRHEESLRVQEERRAQALAEEAKRREAEEAKRKAEAEKLAREQAEKKKQIGNSVAGAFGAGKGKATNHGNGTGTGNQGDPSGVVGGSFDLSGRSIINNGGIPSMPRTNKAIEGKLVIAIEVNSSGVVTQASVRPSGSDIADPTIRAEAIRAARQTKFNPQEGAETQRGIIIYKYVLRH